MEDCKVERLDTGSIDLEEILEDYFAVRPPFENSEKKRKEFPDAFIAEEIKKRFGSDEVVAIVSQDNDFKKACTNSKNHLFFSSLGDLFNTLSKNEEEYTAALELIKSNNDSIIQIIKGMIDDSINYEVGDVLDALKDLISDLKEELVNEQELANSLENCLKQKI